MRVEMNLSKMCLPCLLKIMFPASSYLLEKKRFNFYSLGELNQPILFKLVIF